MLRYSPPSFGWRPDLPDFRDLTCETPSVLEALQALKPRRQRGNSRTLPERVDLRQYFSEPFDQGSLPSSSAHACAALLEYFERRARGRRFCPSRLFLHYNARRLGMHLDDSAVDLRVALKAAAICGAPAECYWPYEPQRVDTAPDAFLYSFVGRIRGMQYVRLDPRNVAGGATLEIVRSFLAAGFPVAFGLAVPTSITRKAEIAYRPTFESVLGGQALVAVGYDDRWLGSCRGALRVRNSWGPEWGDKGYGLLPYAFVAARLAVDFWTVLRPEWLESGEFLRPAVCEQAGQARSSRFRVQATGDQRATGGL